MTIDFDVTAAISRRRSVRTFAPGLSPDADTCRRIMDFANASDNPFGVKGVRMALIRKDDLQGRKPGTYGVIRGATTYIGLGVPDNIEAYVAGGYQMEAVILYATSLGLGTVWLGGTLTRSAFARAFGFDDSLALPAISPIGHPAPKRLLERAMRSIARSDSRKPWGRIFFDRQAGVPLTETEAGAYAEALRNTRLAPSSLNAQPWRLIKIDDQFHFYADFSDSLKGLDRMLKYIDMGIALCHFSLCLGQSGIAGEFYKCDAPCTVPAGYHYVMSWRMTRK